MYWQSENLYSIHWFHEFSHADITSLDTYPFMQTLPLLTALQLSSLAQQSVPRKYDRHPVPQHGPHGWSCQAEPWFSSVWMFDEMILPYTPHSIYLEVFSLWLRNNLFWRDWRTSCIQSDLEWTEGPNWIKMSPLILKYLSKTVMIRLRLKKIYIYDYFEWSSQSLWWYKGRSVSSLWTAVDFFKLGFIPP